MDLQSERKNILFVERDPEIIDTYTRIFKETEYPVQFAHSCDKGFELALKITPDLIFIDLGILKNDTFEFVTKIRKDRYLLNTMIIMVSEDQQLLDADKGINAGADEFLVRPMCDDDLLSKVKLYQKIKSLRDKVHLSNATCLAYEKEKNIYKSELENKNTDLAREKEMLNNALKQMAMMINEREGMLKELSELKQASKDNMNGLVSLLSSTIESKRQYHRRHAPKVAEISVFIANQLKLPEKDIADIKTAALLHELGKLSIPDDITMKHPKDYSLSEKHFVNLHPIAGAVILEKFSGFADVACIIRHIHEHVDGSGLPDKLKKNDIPLGARIIAVANIFDNLVFQNPYDTMENVFEIIEDNINTRFDPKIVHYLHQYASMNPLNKKDNAEVINLYELKPGMRLAASIYTRNGAVLVPMKTVLTQEAINQIAQYTKKEPIEKTVFIK